MNRRIRYIRFPGTVAWLGSYGSGDTLEQADISTHVARVRVFGLIKETLLMMGVNGR